MLTHVQLIRQMRVLGDNYDLIAYLVKTNVEDIRRLANSIKDLSLTPITKFDGFSLCRGLVKDDIFRLSIKNKKMLLIDQELKTIEIRNYSGKPEEYDPYLDIWSPNYDRKADYISISSTEFGEITASAKGNTVDQLNLLNIRGFIVDYGKRDFFVDVLTYEEEILDELEYFPFIRVAYKVINPENIILYLIELYVPECYINLVIKTVDYMCRAKLCEKIISSSV
ncbi:hypothetical protein [Stygiolobus caldivivus]|uniref:Uncharacterized protein n=1 Tax=Stygiolobus caldivivus TaxID=2824673 RepID=A0A8D5U535_9CREN|nr:hypothetical protein [Stygiolobus caldivivus]BCU69248.1 hypothetical protein KN1_05450 [Stygiolobus caldivivus]